MLKKICLWALAFTVLLIPVAVLAQWNPGELAETNLPETSVAQILKNFIQWAVTIVGLLGVIVFIYAGYLYLTAQGDPTQLEKAKKVVIWAIAGIAVAILGLVAVTVIDSIIGGGGGSYSGSSAPSYVGGDTTGSSSGLIRISQ